jgi:outer membrane protein OmpA-like peptidoglycan-associated protein
LNEFVELMKSETALIVEISGHTDNVGSPESNLTLSLQRANAVKNYLISKGIAANRIETKGYGDTQPIAPNTDAEGRQENRRTEVRIIKE